jgi:hypothetical protein
MIDKPVSQVQRGGLANLVTNLVPRCWPRCVAPGTVCPRCGRRHKSWRTVAECRWHPALWVSGLAPPDATCYATVSFCGHPYPRTPRITVCLWDTRARAEAALTGINHLGCGGSCRRRHQLIVLEPAPGH